MSRYEGRREALADAELDARDAAGWHTDEDDVAAENEAASHTRTELARLLNQITPADVAVPEHETTVDVGGRSNFTVRCSCGYTCGVATTNPDDADRKAAAHVAAFTDDIDPFAWLPEGPR